MKSQGRQVAAYYESQNELIAELLGVNKQHTDDVIELQSEQRRRKQRQVDMAVRVSVFVNVLVVLAQLYAAISSKSLSLFAAMSEAMMDLLSSIILLLASIAARRRDRFSLYPSGRYKLETIGVIVFAVLMGTFSVALLAESIQALLSSRNEPNQLSLYDGICVLAALVAKIGLFFYCYTLREYNSAHVLMTDHRNDVFVNSFGLTMAIIGKHLWPWMDPVGSLIIALMILSSWVEEAWDQVKLIVGISADPHLLQILTYTAITHDPRIDKVDRVVAYHSGSKLFVEVDIVMPPSTPLIVLHDVAESLQEKYENMPDIGRCHVHVDYEVTHRSEHRNAEA
ncbi:cation efflux protein [Linderina pennispora]|uniref:Cation efflux protein n=1 Tax=Linderina pennispora TaxID=61395 RepID=A0A1Y1W7R8_9FUNG|nr:cation efflux protein [Linderina pennispora]ORX69425.1 cation efflux protein [Linderina pennispora]